LVFLFFCDFPMWRRKFIRLQEFQIWREDWGRTSADFSGVHRERLEEDAPAAGQRFFYEEKEQQNKKNKKKKNQKKQKKKKKHFRHFGKMAREEGKGKTNRRAVRSSSFKGARFRGLAGAGDREEEAQKERYN